MQRSVRPGARLKGRLGLLFLLTIPEFVFAAQLPIAGKAQHDAERFFSGELKEAPLDCHVETRKPFLDYSFRYEIGYVVSCGLAQFAGKETDVGMLLRVKPAKRNPLVFGQSVTVPGAPDRIRGHVDFKHLRADVQFSGVYAAGEGTYENELIVFDPHNRAYRKKWRVHTESDVFGMALKPLEVQSISLPSWNGPAPSGSGLHLTVLLDAAPVSPYSATLRAWDRAFLLGALSSVLRELPLASVRLIAFNLDQQRELYREEHFDGGSILPLAQALAETELGKVSYRTLLNDKGWIDLLRRLLQEECERERPADAVVFVGASQRYRSELDGVDVNTREMSSPLFYIEYSPHPGAEFPDAIERLTKRAHGSIFRLHQPEDLADALEKMRKTLAARP